MLSTKQRKALPDRDFGLPKQRKYPMPDKAHARNAKARASEEEHKGNLTKAQQKKIDRKADTVLHGASREHRKFEMDGR